MHRTVPALLVIALILAAAFPAFSQTTGPWKPELIHRPRLLWEEGDWPTILDRLTREPYITLYARVKSRANGTPAPRLQYYSPTREYGAANIAKDAAFVWAVEGNATLAEKAALTLEDLAVVFNWEDVAALFKLLDYDIHVAEAMSAYCEAYDILAGTGYLDPTRDQAIHDRLELLFVNAWQFYLVDWYSYRQTLNFMNHFTKFAAAFGTAAITLNDSQHATEWINHAMAWGTYKLYNYCSTEEGAYTEGPSYHIYTAEIHLPFFIQYDRFTGGESATFQKRRCNVLGRDCTYTPVFVENPLDQGRVEALARWTVDIRLPDGRCPPFDDSFMIGNFNGLLAGAFADGELAWDWLNMPGAPLYSSYIVDLSADLICTFDDTVTPVEPARGPNIVRPEDGYAIFRTDWGPDAAYALLLAERGKARIMGVMHEHADTLSFLYWAHGQMLAMDPGYIRWEEHQRVRKGIHHNVVAIDGQGPPGWLLLGFGGVDGRINQTDLDSAPQFTVATTRYAQTDWARALIFYEDLLLVGDFLVSDSPHEYAFLLHGNGGGDTGGDFDLTADGARWEIDGVSLDLTLTGTGDVTPSHKQSDHGWHWNQFHTHEVFSGAIGPAPIAGFAAALLPGTTTAAALVQVLDLPAGCGGLEVSNGATDYLLVDKGTEGCEIDGTPSIGVQAGAAWFRPAENRALVFGSDAGLFVSDRRLAWQTDGTSMKVAWGTGWVTIESDAGQGNTIVVQTDGPAWAVTGQCVEDYHASPFFTWVHLNGTCEITVEF